MDRFQEALWKGLQHVLRGLVRSLWCKQPTGRPRTLEVRGAAPSRPSTRPGTGNTAASCCGSGLEGTERHPYAAAGVVVNNFPCSRLRPFGGSLAAIFLVDCRFDCFDVSTDAVDPAGKFSQIELAGKRLECLCAANGVRVNVGSNVQRPTTGVGSGWGDSNLLRNPRPFNG